MMITSTFNQIITMLNDSDLGVLIRESDSLFPFIESLHVLAITCFFGSIAMVDLRLIGVSFLEKPILSFSRVVLPYTWKAFAVAFVTGLLLFVSKADTYSHNQFFLMKMSLLMCAGINMLFFQFATGKNMDKWPTSEALPAAARLAGFTSLVLWVSIIICGRWIGFTLI
ncbi:hypothetical protein G6687_07100 [Polynucleobacter paneuropaeus]|jgi:hypothetical protein|uniref:DUF6644 family protein n=1 Tax=Polynucleobacter paneuropaeus TaxID=2527775 RepID=UPI001BFCF711|nr:DUF6644 family protein [Polynucleobacter paneuropaeus]MBT8516636.1 hypothetical protein [Polynucleobacter paneuropaeus]MBT8522921.1 hypothetical protein [Polynucleobacter paneuropaeus]MBT8554873.1 hypothetical protein [Polynucleobacter paneuropaeus]MBT8560149.1 hypothetical protein [Polynucleobacter paneuropaeus]MBT8622758.1 hypothetical protein [Polynucleobacter paneuropaeus]